MNSRILKIRKDIPKLVEGIVYNTVAYGPAMYIGDCDSDKSPRGTCHRFSLGFGKRKHISPEELNYFLERRNESRV